MQWSASQISLDQTIHVVLIALGSNHRQWQRVCRLIDQLASQTSRAFESHIVVDGNSSTPSGLAAPQHAVQVHSLPTSFHPHPLVDLDKLFWGIERHLSYGHYEVSPLKARLMLPWILPRRVHRAIMLDLDVWVHDDVARLWSHFDSFSPTQVRGRARSLDK